MSLGTWSLMMILKISLVVFKVSGLPIIGNRIDDDLQEGLKGKHLQMITLKGHLNPQFYRD